MIVFRRQEVVSLYATFLLFLLAWLLYGGNYWNGDREAYEAYYLRDSLASWGLEVGYGILNWVSNTLGLSFQLFQIVLSLVTLLLFLGYFFKTTRFVFISFFLYLVIFFPLDYVLMRHTLAFGLVLRGLCVLMASGSSSGIKFIFIILIAALFHQSAIFFSVFAFARSDRLISGNLCLFLFVGVAALYLIVFHLAPLPETIRAHLDVYPASLKSAVFNSLLHGFFVMLVLVAYVYSRVSIVSGCREVFFDRAAVFIVNINLLSCVWLFLYFEAEIFVRLLRGLVFINFFYSLHCLMVKRSAAYFHIIMLVSSSFYVVLYYNIPAISLAILPLFSKNLVIDAF